MCVCVGGFVYVGVCMCDCTCDDVVNNTDYIPF